jgi:hypothetical protein
MGGGAARRDPDGQPPWAAAVDSPEARRPPARPPARRPPASACARPRKDGGPPRARAQQPGIRISAFPSASPPPLPHNPKTPAPKDSVFRTISVSKAAHADDVRPGLKVGLLAKKWREVGGLGRG